MRLTDDLTHQITALTEQFTADYDTAAIVRTIAHRHGPVSIRTIDDLWSILEAHSTPNPGRILDQVQTAIYMTDPGNEVHIELPAQIVLRMTGVSRATLLPNTLAQADIACCTREPVSMKGQQLTWPGLSSHLLELQSEYERTIDGIYTDLSATGMTIADLRAELGKAEERRRQLIIAGVAANISASRLAEWGMLTRQGVRHILVRNGQY